MIAAIMAICGGKTDITDLGGDLTRIDFYDNAGSTIIAAVTVNTLAAGKRTASTIGLT
jgi:hypothetical protein